MKKAVLPGRLRASMAATALLVALGSAGASPGPAPDFGAERPSAPARRIAQWALQSGDAGGRSVVVVDKRAARVFVLDPAGRLRGAAPVLLGLARGDEAVPGIGERPLSQIAPHERTTPAGRFVAEPGFNARGEDIVWVDYGSAVSMHRVRTQVRSERRLQRLDSPTPHDNRISYGCINLPADFYERVLAPAARAGAVIYVLPEVRAIEQVFGLRDAPARPVPARADPAGTV